VLSRPIEAIIIMPPLNTTTSTGSPSNIPADQVDPLFKETVAIVYIHIYTYIYIHIYMHLSYLHMYLSSTIVGSHLGMYTGCDSFCFVSGLDGGRYSVGSMPRLQNVVEV
jgi:hypothetical protein